MSLLRSNLFIAVVSFLVLAGYGFDVFGECCSDSRQALVAHGEASHDKQAPVKDDGCQCICHHVVTPISVECVRATEAALVVADLVALPDEFPPDAVPLGIDHPPQLA